MTAEEVWEQATSAACCAIKWKPSANRRGAAVIRTALEAYAAQKVAEALAAEPTKAMVEAGARVYFDNDVFASAARVVTAIYRAMQATNQHHGGNDADT